MMKQELIFIILIIFGIQGAAQESAQKSRPRLKIGGFGGYAFYSFENLENANKEVISQLPFDASVIDNFPAQTCFGGYVLIKIADWYSIGPAYEFHSTGSRLGAKDYSGSYRFDQTLSTHQLGIENEARISGGIKPAVFINLAGGVNFSSWKIEEELEVAEEVLQNDNTEFVAIKPFVYPALKISYPGYKNLSMFGRAGYLFDLGGKYHLSGNKDYKSTQKIPWSGFRISIGLEFCID
jgi:hypothetical protein